MTFNFFANVALVHHSESGFVTKIRRARAKLRFCRFRKTANSTELIWQVTQLYRDPWMVFKMLC